MRVNAALVIALRAKKAWSQEELSIASGLNLRTIQRIEKEASASLQSMKALASAFAIGIKELEPQETTAMKKYEYKTVDATMQPLQPIAAKTRLLLGRRAFGAMMIFLQRGKLSEDVEVAKTCF